MNQNQNENETLTSYLTIALGQVKRAQKAYEEKTIEPDIRSLSYQILKELIMEQLQNENSNPSAR